MPPTTTITRFEDDILPYRCTTHRVSKYDPKFADVVARLVASGFTQDDVAWVLGVNKSTITDWCAKYPEFRSAYESGKEHAKRTLVAHGIKAACGYNLTTVKTKVRVEGGLEDPDNPGVLLGGKTITETTTDTTHYPPNPTLLMYLLSNIDRQQGRTDWIQKQSGTDDKGKTLILNVNGSMESAKINELIRGIKSSDTRELPDGRDTSRHDDVIDVQAVQDEEEGFDYPAQSPEGSHDQAQRTGPPSSLCEDRHNQAERLGPPDTEKSGIPVVEGHHPADGMEARDDDVF
jgi:hypothetical protein